MQLFLRVKDLTANARVKKPSMMLMFSGNTFEHANKWFQWLTPLPLVPLMPMDPGEPGGPWMCGTKIFLELDRRKLFKLRRKANSFPSSLRFYPWPRVWLHRGLSSVHEKLRHVSRDSPGSLAVQVVPPPQVLRCDPGVNIAQMISTVCDSSNKSHIISSLFCVDGLLDE